MKKDWFKLFMVSFLICVFTCSFCGCGTEDRQGEVQQGQETVLRENGYISPVDLTEEQMELMSLLNMKDSFYIFEYNLDETIGRLELWAEVYQNGKMIDRPIWCADEILDQKNGKICLKISNSQDTSWEWEITSQNEHGYSRWTGNREFDFLSNASFAKGWSNLNGRTEIIADQEIGLLQIYFSDDGSMSIYDAQYCIEHPEVLEEYDYAILVKCCFGAKQASVMESAQ